MSLLEYISRYVAYPVWNAKDRSIKLKEFRRLDRSQWLSLDGLNKYQLGRLQLIMEHAYTTVPYYRDRWTRDPVAKPLRSIKELEDFPVLTKQDVRNHQAELISKRFCRNSLMSSKTGGSTGVALELFFDKRCQEYRNAAQMMSDRWAGWRPGMLVGALWGSPPLPDTVRSKVRSIFHDRYIFLDTMNLNESTMSTFLSEIVVKKVKVLFGHAHSLYVLADYIGQTGKNPPNLHGIISTSMMLLDNHRKRIEEVFKIPVTNRYGCEEVGLIASQCERHKKLHINVNHVVVQTVADSERKFPDHTGELIVTDLNNYAMPLIRYNTEDVSSVLSQSCECGRGLPLMGPVRGRTSDYLLREDGGLVSGISLVENTLTAFSGIAQLQLIQTAINHFTVNVVKDDKFSDDVLTGLEQELGKAFSADLQVEFVIRESIEQESNGKYRFAKCLLNT